MPVPRYAIPVGSELRLHTRDLTVVGQDEHGYTVEDTASGTTTFISFKQLVDQLKLPGVRVDVLGPTTGRRLECRLGGFVSSEGLPVMQRQLARFHLAIANAIDVLQEELRRKTGRPDAEITSRYADANRERIRDIAQDYLGEKIHLTPPRGGQGRYWTLYRGRTLMKYARAARGVGPGESPLDAVTPLDHLKGNATSRLPARLRELMTKAWEDVGLDLKALSVASVQKRLEVLVKAENEVRCRNCLGPLITPSQATLKTHRDRIMTPTEFSIATLGERETRRRSGRGSTDMRALLIGEYVEIDECKASLVVSAKAGGVWERLGQKDQSALHEIDKEIRERLHILVMLDVASRMPLAWIVTDQPRADATKALLRMATRDKSREKILYGCENEPMPSIGIGHVKADNGPGLRNAVVIGAVLGVGGIMTIARAYSPTDKPYIERMFGTLESVLLSLIHGYTGRRPGHLPAYDAVENGVLDLELLQEILTRFMVDEYPSMRHAGVGMGMRRPIEVFKEINETRGCFPPIDADHRRIALGWEQSVKASDEGVKVFGIFFNSDRLQALRDKHRVSGRLRVFVDPDNLSSATVLLPKVTEPVQVQIQCTAFADMTLPEVQDLIALYRKEDPTATQLYEDILFRLRRDRQLQLRQIARDKGLSRSYSTLDEAARKAKSLLAGSRIVPSEALAGTTRPGRILDGPGADSFIMPISDEMLIEGMASEPPARGNGGEHDTPVPLPIVVDTAVDPVPVDHLEPIKPTAAPLRNKDSRTSAGAILGRPKNLKELE